MALHFSLSPRPRTRGHSGAKARRLAATLGLTIGLVGATISVTDSVGSAASDPNRLGHDFVVTDDGTYIWYNDQRAVVKDRTLMTGFVQVDGTAGITSVDLATGRRLGQTVPLKSWGTGDDHNNPAILPMNNGRVGIFYTGHDWGSGRGKFSRISTTGIPLTAAELGPERFAPATIDGRPAAATYSNVFQLSGEQNKIYDFFRLSAHNTYFQTYDSNGNLLTPAPIPLVVSGGGWTNRQYVKYASNGVNRIDMVFTNGHPWRENLNMYHAYYQGGNMYKSDGTLIGNVINDGPFSLEQMTEIYNQDAVGDRYTPWNHELKIDPNGNPVLVYSRQLDPYTLDYGYATYQPSTNQWVHTTVADAGDSMIPTTPIDPYDNSRAGGSQPDYAGGIALNPLNVSEVFISTTVNPITGATTNKFEIYRGVLANGAFTWTPITQNSPEDNYRPFVPVGAQYNDQVVIWFSGKYESFVNTWRGRGADRHFYTGYDTRIVGRYLHRASEQADDHYAIDFNGPNAITPDGFRPAEGSGEAPFVTERATVALVNSRGSRERAGAQDDLLGDFGFSYPNLDVSISDLTPGYYQFSLTNYDTWNPQDVAVEFFPTGSAPVTVVASHSQTDSAPVSFGAQVAPNTDYTLRLRRLGNKATVLNSLEIIRLGDSAPPVASFTPGTDMNVTAGTTLTFDGSASVDPDGGPLQFTWRSTGMSGVAATSSTFSRPFNTPGRVGVELIVTDDEGQWTKKRINVWVSAAQAAPSAVDPSMSSASPDAAAPDTAVAPDAATPDEVGPDVAEEPPTTDG